MDIDVPGGLRRWIALVGIEDSRARIMNSNRLPRRLGCANRISASNIDTGLSGGRPPFEPSP
ncbi:hypothetical protein [Thalassobaculum salexigens]|uniref:hypothetical protein n=1 Tax=Thalassobaculum salexigens TaxID=455360 RepID=UPI0012EBF327|nr:hypothetical protein [Thalassobaculum salexigens]